MTDYVRAVRTCLGAGASRAELEALDDLHAAIEEMGDGDAAAVVAAFGTPQEYAERLRAALGAGPGDEPSEPAPAQARVLGVPVETRGMTRPQVRARVWDPSNPAVWVPRLMGGGWTVNLGAVAVRLGLLRPDDCDPDVVAHIPPGTARAAHAVPLVLSAVSCAAVAASWRALPPRVPTSWSATGRVQRTGGRATVAILAAAGAAAALWSARETDPEDALVSGGIGT